MFKDITPTQEWLLSEGRCIGCGASLKETRRIKRIGTTIVVICPECGRNFVYNKTARKYYLPLF